jgi:hypothetical protein
LFSVSLHSHLQAASSERHNSRIVQTRDERARKSAHGNAGNVCPNQSSFRFRNPARASTMSRTTRGVGTRLEVSTSVQLGHGHVGAHEAERDYLCTLGEKLREAIAACLTSGRPHLAVALDTARDAVETVLADEQATSARLAVARARAEIALETWREANDVRH